MFIITLNAAHFNNLVIYYNKVVITKPIFINIIILQNQIKSDKIFYRKLRFVYFYYQGGKYGRIY